LNISITDFHASFYMTSAVWLITVTTPKSWNEGSSPRSASRQIIREMKAIVSDFQGFRFCFTRREANKAAHACAREALSIVRLDITFDLIPNFLIEPVQSDILSLFE
jgi:hypothetical protein